MDEKISDSSHAAAAARWAQRADPAPPWLHDEVGLRVAERLEILQLHPSAWANWHHPRGGLGLHQALQERWPDAAVYCPDVLTINNIAIQAGLTNKNAKNTLKKGLDQHPLKALLGQVKSMWPGRRTARTHEALPPVEGVQCIVSNMLLHSHASPQLLLESWHRSLATDGLVFFSCLGPDTLRPLQNLYRAQAWGPPLQRLVDMHDWGDALVNAGFATPVMEMERIELSYSSAAALLAELRELGRNLAPQRFQGLRGKAWQARLVAEIEQIKAADGRIYMPFEIIYGHAFKPRPQNAGETVISLNQLRQTLPSRQTP